jgi:hypothetical protein
MRTAITDLEERRDPRAKFKRRCNEAFVALEKNDACQGRGDDHDNDDHDDDGIVDPNAFYLDVQMPPPCSVLINVHVCSAHATTASEAV